MPRFFVPSPQLDLASGKVTLLGDDAHHIARSLRMAVGDTVTVCDMHGTTNTCRLTHIRDDEVEAEIVSSVASDTEPPCRIHLYMAYPKGDKLETVIQKAVELGASRITPFESERCVKRPAPEKADRISERLNRIASEAAKQCGRGVLPTVEKPLTFAQMLEEAGEADLPLFCYEGDGTRSLRALIGGLTCPSSISVVVGSEGGFSQKEADAARARGLRMVSLGRRILRCETAPAYVLSALSFQFELSEV
jgi:16S rRNA (uracil1498-N3)-methyltransferase